MCILQSAVLPLSEVAFDDPGAAWVRAPLYRLVHVLLLHLATLPDLKDMEVRKKRVRECATMLSSARFSVEVDFAVEEVSALESRLVDIAQQGYRAAGLVIIGAVKSVVYQKMSSDFVDGLRAAASAGFGYFKKLKGTERLQHIASVSSSDLGALKDVQQVLRKHRGNWIIEVASAAAWVSCGHR